MADTVLETEGQPVTPAAPQGTGQTLDMNAQIEFKVDGQIVKKPLSEVVTLASKASGAERKFQEAAEERRKNQEAVEMYTCYQKVAQGKSLTQSEQSRYAELLGLDDEQFQAMYRESQKPQGSHQAPPAQVPSIDPTREVIPPAVQDAIRRIDTLWNVNVERQIDTTIESAITGNEYLRTVLEKVQSEDDKAKILEYIRGDVRDRAMQRASTGRSFGPHEAASAVSTVADLLKRVGTQPAVTPAQAFQFPNMGAAFGSVQMPDLSKPEPKRVPATDQAQYSSNLGQRLLHRIASSLSKGTTT